MQRSATSTTGLFGAVLSLWSALGLLAGCGAEQHAARSTNVAPPASVAAESQTTPAASRAPASAMPPSGTVPPEVAALMARARGSFGTLPTPPQEAPELIALGRRLFFETRVSADRKVGCVTCHEPALWGTDGLSLARGVFERKNPRNAPTVLNAAYQTVEHWRGDRKSVEDQARRALLGKASFGLASDAEAVQKLDALPAPYPEAFRRAFPNDPDPVSVRNWGTAIGAYERTLLTPGPLDKFLAGDAAALSDDARAGLKAFMDQGCADCHDGPLVGGRSLRVFGVRAVYAPLTHSNPVDQGRFDVTHDPRDRFVFKVAQLRNVAKTAPYFHDGSVATLPEAVEIMAQTQLGKRLPPQEVNSIVSFLDALTGPVPANFSRPAP